MSQIIFLLALASSLAALPAPKAPENHAIRAKWSLVKPSDLGPETIDVSSYPKDLQDIYRYVVPERCLRCHTAARIWNSPFVEMSEARQLLERAKNPELFSSEDLAQIGDDVWKRYIKRMQAFPACCGGCSDMNEFEIKDLHRFLVYDSIKRKTGASAADWIAHRRKLVRAYVQRSQR